MGDMITRLVLLIYATVAHGSFTSEARRCDAPYIYAVRESQKSQFNEDLHLHEHYFHGVCNGTYLEMGANDGVTMSNTYLLNDKFQWRGILIEGSPSNYKALVQSRPNELAVLNNVVCDPSQKSLHFVVRPEMEKVDFQWQAGSNHAVDGILEFMPNWYKDMFHSEKGGKKRDVREVECTQLSKVFREQGVRFVDFFSLDVEGAELSVIKTIDWSQVQFGLIIVEDLRARIGKGTIESVSEYIQSQGYVYVETYAGSHWLVNRNFRSIYKRIFSREQWENSAILRLIAKIT